MENSASIIAQCPGESRLTRLGSDGEHVALLGLPGGYAQSTVGADIDGHLWRRYSTAIVTPAAAIHKPNGSKKHA